MGKENNLLISIGIELENVIKYKEPIELKEIGVKVAPQSYMYI